MYIELAPEMKFTDEEIHEEILYNLFCDLQERKKQVEQMENYVIENWNNRKCWSCGKHLNGHGISFCCIHHMKRYHDLYFWKEYRIMRSCEEFQLR